MKRKLLYIIPLIILIFIGIYYFLYIRTVGKDSIPVITYHSIENENPDKNEYIVKTSDFENMILSLKNEGFTFIDCYDLEKIINGEMKLPENPIMVTFDDGYADNYSIAYPILKKYNAKAVIFLIGSYVDKPGYLKWPEITEMSLSGLVDFESHTYNLHDLFLDGPNKNKTWFSKKLEGESDEHYYEKLRTDLVWNNNLIYEHSSRFPIAIAYPGSMTNDIAIKAVKDSGLKLGFIGADKTASKLKDLNPYEIKRFHIKDRTNVKNMVRFLHSNN